MSRGEIAIFAALLLTPFAPAILDHLPTNHRKDPTVHQNRRRGSEPGPIGKAVALLILFLLTALVVGVLLVAVGWVWGKVL